MKKWQIRLKRDFGTKIVGTKWLRAGDIIEVCPAEEKENITMGDVLDEINRHVDFHIGKISGKDIEVVGRTIDNIPLPTLDLEGYSVVLDCIVDVQIEGHEDAIDNIFLIIVFFTEGKKNRLVELSSIADVYGMKIEKKNICIEGVITNFKVKKGENNNTILSFQLIASSKTWVGCFDFFKELERLVKRKTGESCHTTIDTASYRKII